MPRIHRTALVAWANGQRRRMLHGTWGALVFGAVLVGAIGCFSDSTPSGPSAPRLEPALVLTGSARLATCSRQSAVVVSKTIDRNGGSLTLNGHQLYIPPNALSQPVTITMSAPVDTVRTVQLQPEGLTFNPLAQPTLSLNYKGCQQAVAGVAYVTNDLQLLAFLGSTVNPAQNSTSTRLSHFSRYAVHY